MKRVIFSVFFVVLFLSVGHCEPVLDEQATRRIDALIENAIARRVTPGAAVIIGTADRILYAKAFGRLTYDQDSAPVTLDTMFDLASVSKAVGTTSATMFLFQDGKLSLDDPVCKYIPAFNREDKRAITIRHLLTHSSGLPSYTQAAKAEADRKPGESRADALIRHIASLPLKYKTGEGHLYACLNFITLARVNEEVAGISQESFLKQRLFDPLGMTNTAYTLSDDQRRLAAPTVGAPNFRQGTVHDPLAAYYSDSNHSGGNAGLFSSANDLAIFCQMLLSGGKHEGVQVLESATIDRFVTNSLPLRLREMYGLGWARYLRYPYATKLNRGYARAAFGHNGYTGTFVHLDRYAGTFLVALTNRVYPDDKSSDLRFRREILEVMVSADPLYADVLPGR